jgi:hypothetical protein
MRAGGLAASRRSATCGTRTIPAAQSGSTSCLRSPLVRCRPAARRCWLLRRRSTARCSAARPQLRLLGFTTQRRDGRSTLNAEPVFPAALWLAALQAELICRRCLRCKLRARQGWSQPLPFCLSVGAALSALVPEGAAALTQRQRGRPQAAVLLPQRPSLCRSNGTALRCRGAAQVQRQCAAAAACVQLKVTPQHPRRSGRKRRPRGSRAEERRRGADAGMPLGLCRGACPGGRAVSAASPRSAAATRRLTLSARC